MENEHPPTDDLKTCFDIFDHYLLRNFTKTMGKQKPINDKRKKKIEDKRNSISSPKRKSSMQISISIDNKAPKNPKPVENEKKKSVPKIAKKPKKEEKEKPHLYTSAEASTLKHQADNASKLAIKAKTENKQEEYMKYQLKYLALSCECLIAYSQIFRHEKTFDRQLHQMFLYVINYCKSATTDAEKEFADLVFVISIKYMISILT